MTSMLLTPRYACCDLGFGTADINEAPYPNPLPQGGRGAGNAQPSFEQSRGVMPFSVAYFAADSSIIGRTIDWSEPIQSVIVYHFAPTHCKNYTTPPLTRSILTMFRPQPTRAATSCLRFPT